MAICQLNRNRCPAEQISALNATHLTRVTANPEFDDGDHHDDDDDRPISTAKAVKPESTATVSALWTRRRTSEMFATSR
jgi:hypothetical protein